MGEAVKTGLRDEARLCKQGYFTILLDEIVRGLEAGLENDGFKVFVAPQGLSDEALKRKARGWAILTKNPQDFVDDAVRYDYDVIGIEDIGSVDDGADVPTKRCARFPRPCGGARSAHGAGISG